MGSFNFKPVMTYSDFSLYVYSRTWPEDWRRGQVWFNALHRVRPDLSEKVRGTQFDPFYQDDRVPKFINWLAENW